MNKIILMILLLFVPIMVQAYTPPGTTITMFTSVTYWDSNGVFYDPPSISTFFTTPPDTDPPTIKIISPTSTGIYATNKSLINISGTASDDYYVVLVSWFNNIVDVNINGNCVGTITWNKNSIPLGVGFNTISVKAIDAGGHTTQDVLIVEYSLPIDTILPVVIITNPITSSSFSTLSPTIILKGIATDNIGVSRVIWNTNIGQSGTCAGTTYWQTPSINLTSNKNIIYIKAFDIKGNSSYKSVTITK
jgi:hypothetical protein